MDNITQGKVNDIENIQKEHNAKIAFIAGVLDAWVITLEDNPEMTSNVISNMKTLANSLKKNSGVKFKET